MDSIAKVFSIFTILVVVIFLLPVIYYMFKKKTDFGVFLGITSIYSGIAVLAYATSLLRNIEAHYLYAMVMSTLYFTSIDCLLLFFVLAAVAYTKSANAFVKSILIIITALCVVDLGMLWANCFCSANNQFCVSLSWVEEHPTIPIYSTKWPWFFHLSHAYCMVIVATLLFLNKAHHVPKGYRRQYIAPIIALLFIVLVNVVFLAIQTNNTESLVMIDVSTLAYPAGMWGVYYAIFTYPNKVMVARFKNRIVDNGFNGIIGFDWENKLFVVNDRAKMYFPELEKHKGKEIHYLAKLTGLSILESNSRVCQCFTTDSNGYPISLRCDYIVDKNKDRKVLSKTFYLQDISPETDPLTGFQMEEAFHHTNETRDHVAMNPKAVVLFDIRGLGMINAARGHDGGDRVIKHLAESLSSNFPKDTYFIKGNGGTIYAITISLSVIGVKNVASDIVKNFNDADLDFAVLPFNPNEPIKTTMGKLQSAVQNEKLLNSKSSKSNMIASLLKALEETDIDTEAHVKRTTINAEKLGKRLGLFDYDLSRLKLLTVLHDIGKIAIPLEILNKPGKLTEQEFEIMKTHTIKGYEIAKSNKALVDIALDIRQHHERWDGKGYPDGLAKESISYLARIVSVVDSFDAMTNNRIYRKALTWDEAKEEMRRSAGTQFDPRVVSEFLAMLDEEVHIESTSDKKEQKVLDISLANVPVNRNVFPMTSGKYITDENDEITEVDEGFTAITGYTMEDCKNRKLNQQDLIPEDDLVEYVAAVQKQFATGTDVVLLEHRIVKKDGSNIYVYCLGRRHFETFSKKIMNEITIVECSLTHAARLVAEREKERAAAQRESWERRYRKDGLTGLLAHNAFENDVANVLLHERGKLLFMMFDLDGFKLYNDTYGHKAGDEYLILAANHLATSIRKEDLCCRLGGDEFAAVIRFDENDNIQSIKDRAKTLLDQINDSFTLVSKSFCKFSCGVSLSGPAFNAFDKLYIDADKALYESKTREKGTISYGSSFQ